MPLSPPNVAPTQLNRRAVDLSAKTRLIRGRAQLGGSFTLLAALAMACTPRPSSPTTATAAPASRVASATATTTNAIIVAHGGSGASQLPAKLPTKPKDRLRRVVHVPSVKVGKVVTLSVLPPNAHHINGHGPNWLALYDTSDASKQIFAVRSDAILSGVLVLPELVDGHQYRLQGTLYYCTDGAGSCLMQSHDQVLIADSRDASQLDIALRAP